MSSVFGFALELTSEQSKNEIDNTLRYFFFFLFKNKKGILVMNHFV